MSDSKALRNLEDENLSLCRTISHISKKEIDKKNKKSLWSYGYNSEHDVIVISKTGKIGDVVEIQTLKIALPLQENKIHSRSNVKAEQ